MEEIGINATAGKSSTVNAGNSPRSKQKKKSLCRLLMNKKTKVGCLGASYKEEEQNKPCRLDDSQHGSQTSTKFTLCCARTERSSTPPQSLTISRLSPASLSPMSVRSETASANGNCQTNMIAERTENQKTTKDKNTMIVPKDSPKNMEEGNISVKGECFHSRYLQGDWPTLESLKHDCLLHPLPKLPHRTSADNLVTNSPPTSIKHSSPESVKSAPGQMKPRSTSEDTLSPKKNMRHMSGVAGASMDSLAKNALIAAKVFNLIPAQKARERNFLHGRCAATSLLGPTELEKVLPNRELKIFIGTWNMNGQTPPKELNDFMLPAHIESVPDMLAIGTQESCSERFEWEVALQETLGPTHVLLSSIGFGTLHLALFLRRDLIWYCSITEEDSFSTRTGSAFRTKGAVALSLILFGTSFLFVTAHLTAHQDKVKERISDIKRIVRNLDLPKELPIKHKSKDVTQNFDCVFWCGDLNFRLAQPREEVIQWVTGTSFPQQNPINLVKDQLKTTLKEDTILRGFEEGPITFPPTYKYDPGTQNFDSSSKQRIPAYTDRILFKGKSHNKGYIRRLSYESMSSQRDGVIECLVYDSVPSICTSDHKPVWGVFKTTIRPGVDTIPLSAGLFNHEVYAEGIKRRVAAMDEYRETAKVCSIQ